MITINEDEIEKFSKISNEWWNPDGKFRPLHMINPIRLEFILKHINNHFGKNKINILDIGCGGGLIAEPLAKLGFIVTAIDASQKNIEIANKHASKNNVSIYYRHSCIENLILEEKKYDLILALEVVEHVDNLELFVEYACKLLNENGLIIFSTINRTIKSFFQAIIGAEYILNWVPKGTHQWRKFISPSDLFKICEKHNMNLIELKGMKFSIVTQDWKLCDNVDVNYFMTYSSNYGKIL